MDSNSIFIVFDTTGIRHTLAWVHRYETIANELILYEKHAKKGTVIFHLDKIIYYGFFDNETNPKT